MNELEFYRSLYQRELNRRNDLDNAVNIPIGIITLLTALLYFLINHHKFECLKIWNLSMSITIFLSIILLLIGIFFLSKSFNNLFVGFKYLNFPTTRELRNYQIQLENYEIENKTENIKSFNNYIIEKYVDYSDSHIKINDKRALSLYRAKTLIICSLTTSFISLCLYLLKSNLL